MLNLALRAVCATVAVAALSGEAAAQDAAGALSKETGSATIGIGDIVVTATRRETKLQRTPISETAISGETLEQSRITSFTDLARLVPSLTFTNKSSTESYFSIRGTTVNNDSPGSNQGVSLFIDDVPMTGIGDSNPDLFDLQSVEILRGPQGTLFGRNVTGGAVVVRTLAPSFTPEQRVQLTYGNYNLAQFRGYLTGPVISDQVAGKFSLDAERQDGYLYDTALGRKVGGLRNIAARGQLLWEPSSDFSLLLGGDYRVDTSPDKYQAQIGDYQPHLFPTLSYDPRDVNAGQLASQNVRVGGLLARATYNFDAMTLTSISGFRDVDSRLSFSTSGDPTNELLQRVTLKDQQYSEEIHLASAGSKKFTWLTGVFLLYASKYYDQHYDIDLVPGVAATYVPPYSALNFTADSIQSIKEYSFAGFANASYLIIPTLQLTIGARVSSEHKSGESAKPDTSGTGTSITTSGPYGHTWRSFDPKATLSFTPTNKILAYATISSGFKSGGFDLSSTTATGLRQPFLPERVWNYEVGTKLTALRNRLVVDASLYYADYTNLQTFSFNPTSFEFQTGNAGSAHVPGLELEVTALPVSWLTVGGGYTYIDAKFHSYRAADGSFDYSGNQIPFVPKNQLHLSANGHFSGIRRGNVDVGGDVSFASSVHYVDANNEIAAVINRTPIKGLVNLHLGWSSHTDLLTVLLWGKNITGLRTLINANDLNALYADPLAGELGKHLYDGRYTPPATFGVSVTVRH